MSRKKSTHSSTKHTRDDERGVNEPSQSGETGRIDTDPVQAEGRFRQLIEGAPNGMVVVNELGQIILTNAELERMFGYHRDELLGESIEALVPERFRTHHSSYRQSYISRPSRRPMGNGRDLFGRRKDGSEFPVEIGLNPIQTDNGVMIVGTIADITERKYAEERLRESEYQLNQAQRITHIGSWSWDLTTDTLSWSDELFRIFGLEPTDTAPKYAELQEKFIYPDDVQFVEDSLQQAFSTGEPFDFVYRLRRPDGSLRYLHARGEGITDENGRSVKYFGTARDITAKEEDDEQQERMMEVVRASEERYRFLFESNPLPMWVYDLETLAFLEVNDTAIQRYGYSRDEFLAMKITDIRASQEAEGLIKEVAAVNSPLGETKVWKHLKKDGTELFVEVTAHSIDFKGRSARLILANDISERRLLEEQLRQSQKMEAIGLLAGGIAHDFNNLLTAINGYSALILRKLAPTDPFYSNLTEINRAGERAAALTGQLLAFSRKQVLEPKVMDMNNIVRDVETLLQRIIGENIDLRATLSEDLSSIRADPGQIEQIVMNLVINARDAMPNGGKLTIETKNVYLDETYARTHISVEPGLYVMLAVSDTGMGMDESTRRRIFEPFFSTKPMGSGTGLGLSTTYGIVKQSGGNIWVYSEVGRGTVFKVYLPATNEAAMPAEQTALNFVLRGDETILLVEDEELVRTFAAEVLRDSGYTVLEAASGSEALKLGERYSTQITLLLTDVVMPEISGRELADKLVEVCPVKVLYMSGYTDSAIVHQGVLDESSNFIHKPFKPDDLARKVRQVLDSKD